MVQLARGGFFFAAREIFFSRPYAILRIAVARLPGVESTRPIALSTQRELLSLLVMVLNGENALLIVQKRKVGVGAGAE